MLDRFNRRIDYLRVSVTDRCDLRCIYCMPEKGVRLKRRADVLSYEQIALFTTTAARMGISKVRLTGGEPLVRRNIEALVGMLAGIAGLQEICMTTNGVRLAQTAATLKEHGLTRVNVSIDSLDPERYRRITRGGDLKNALAGVDAALDAGLSPVKINMVMLEDTTEQELRGMREFCADKGLLLQRIARFSLREPREKANPRRTERPPACSLCNRIRLSADGFLKPCLFTNREIRVDFNAIEESVQRALAAKPESGSVCRNRAMIQIGG